MSDAINNIVIVSGDCIDGINIIGPFLDFEFAIEYAEKELNNNPWWATEVIDPNKNIISTPIPF